MRLGTYLDAQKITREAFADQVGVHAVTVSKWVTGSAMPRPAKLVQIAKATNHQVTSGDFLAGFQARSEARKDVEGVAA